MLRSEHILILILIVTTEFSINALGRSTVSKVGLNVPGNNDHDAMMPSGKGRPLILPTPRFVGSGRFHSSGKSSSRFLNESHDDVF
ncbi:hypothetical protein SRHO_G00016840 [Serrasalmus rhombeus]